MIFRLVLGALSTYFVNIQDFLKVKTLDLIKRLIINTELTKSNLVFKFFSNGRNNHSLLTWQLLSILN